MLNVHKKEGYVFDGGSPISYVVATLARAPGALAIPEIVQAYDNSMSVDISRIRYNEHLSTNEAAKEWLIKWALTQLGPKQIEEIDGTHYKLKIPAEKIRWKQHRVYKEPPAGQTWPGGSEPFNSLTQSGVFNRNIRLEKGDDLTELRESMREFGWVKQFPAIQDENGVTLVGHRRIKVAKELDIDPCIATIKIGRGAQADAERLKIAIVSNIGFRPMSPESRRRISKYLYNDLNWEVEKIAQALRVSGSTIQNDTRSARSQTLGSRKDSQDRINTGRISLPPETEAEISDRLKQGESRLAITKDLVNPEAKRVSRIVERIAIINETQDKSEEVELVEGLPKHTHVCLFNMCSCGKTLEEE